MNKFPLVSVIVPTYNEQGVIERLIISIKKQSFPNIEIVVVDDGSNDKTANIAKKYTPNVFTRKHAERSVQRNFGARSARGKFLVFLDSDMELTKNVITDCVKEMNSDSGIGGIIIPEESRARNFWEKVKAFERSFYNEEGDGTTDAARFFRRQTFEKVGGYDESITGPEDWDLPESIKSKGYSISRIKSRILHHEKVLNLFTLMKKKYYYGLKSYRYLKKQNISIIGPKTIYFLRPVFYRNWRKLISNPILSIAMIVIFFFELFGGGVGYLVGKYLHK